MSIGKGEGVDEESNKKWFRKEGVQSKKVMSSQKLYYVLFTVTQSGFLLGFSWSSANITAPQREHLKESTSKK